MVVFRQYLARGFPFGILQRHRNQLFLNAPALVGLVGQLLRTQCKLVLHGARDSLLLAVKLGGVGHVEPAVAVEQRHHQRIFELASGSKGEAVAPANA